MERCRNKAVQNRLCTLCDTANVEDEFQFSCHFPLIAIAINANFCKFTAEDNFFVLLFKYLGRYIAQAWIIRRKKWKQ